MASPVETPSAFRKELTDLINTNSLENGSDTPDFILAQYLNDCLDAFDKATKARGKWWGHVTPSDHGNPP